MDRLKEGERILKEIAEHKERLVRIAMDKGLHSSETIRCSQELDELINSFYRSLQIGYENSRY
ncbi:aspartyl-phosphate phosphatase Spo0E family protein [Robertmurraya massiliosenegalensis]|uniref:aspartyl-phosphate phosphatase Spo0E family protein n=1 Tax=Robertmurraya TaxID=2837507 RepID=UPI0039A448ED